MSNFIVGQRPLVTTPPDGPFTDGITGEPVDPTVVTLEVTINGGTTTVYTYGVGDTITRDGIGLYHAVLDTTGLPGAWQVSWVSDPDGTSPQVCVAIQTTTFNVYGAGIT